MSIIILFVDRHVELLYEFFESMELAIEHAELILMVDQVFSVSDGVFVRLYGHSLVHLNLK